MKPLYAITSVFNPRRFQSRWKLYHSFAKWIERAGVKLLTVEVAFGNRKHEVSQNCDPWHLQLRTRQELWHKERALNLGLHRLSQLDPNWEYVAWMDADIKLARDDWATETVHLLQHYAVVQLFGEASSLGPHYQSLFTCKSIAHNFEEHGIIEWGENPGLQTRDVYARQGHPGLAWGFRRDELNDVGGWLDTCINGSGDLHMMGCYSGMWDLALSPRASVGYRDSIRRYGELCNKFVKRNVSYLPGCCDHYWHGRSKERGYEERWKLLDQFQFDPATDLIQDVQGLYKWSLHDDRVRALAVATRKSLASRNEDATEI